MTKFAPLFSAVVATLLAAAPVMAADQVAVISVDRGTVMVSQGGEFTPAQTGLPVAANNRLMVTEQAAVTVTYPNGCTREYTAPGVYVIAAECRVVAGTSARTAALVIAGTGVAGAALLGTLDEVPPMGISR